MCKNRHCKTVKPINQAVGILPSERIDEPECFKHQAIDFLGPILTKVDHCSVDGCSHNKQNDHPPVKRWILIATCLASRAIVLEMVHSLNTEDLILALRRLFAKHSMPETVFSDCGTQLKAGDRELQRLLRRVDWQRLKEEKAFHGIEWKHPEAKRPIVWKYSVEKASHQMGLVERLISPVKRCLRTVLQQQTPSDVTLQTTLVEISGMLNARPITAVYEPEKGIETALTPNHLIYGRSTSLLPTILKDVSKTSNFKESWRQRQQLLGGFWRKWQKMYLLSLAPLKREGWVKRKEDPLKEGDVVLIREENLGKNTWKLARVTGLHRSKDGAIRSASLKIPSGNIVHRHMKHLSLLEAAH